MRLLGYIPLVAAIAGLILLIIGGFSVRQVWRLTAHRTPKTQRKIRLVLFGVGTLLIVPVSSLHYWLDERTVVYGVPFMSAIFQKEGQYWSDFVGPLTLPAVIGNAAVAVLLPFVIAAPYFCRRWRQPNSG